MAGAAGHVRNNSGFASFRVKTWMPWMTEMVILHASGVSIPELCIRFDKTATHLSNIIRTKEATDIIRKIQLESMKATASTSSEKITAIKDMALNNLLNFLANETLREEAPMSFWDQSRKTLETVSKMESPAAAPVSSTTTNIQQNFIASPDLLDKLRSAPTMTPLQVPANVEYLGPPPATGSSAQGVQQSGGAGATSQSKNGLTLLGGRDSLSSDTK